MCRGKECGKVRRAGYGWEQCGWEYEGTGRDVVTSVKDVAAPTRGDGPNWGRDVVRCIRQGLGGRIMIWNVAGLAGGCNNDW